MPKKINYKNALGGFVWSADANIGSAVQRLCTSFKYWNKFLAIILAPPYTFNRTLYFHIRIQLVFGTCVVLDNSSIFSLYFQWDTDDEF